MSEWQPSPQPVQSTVRHVPQHSENGLLEVESMLDFLLERLSSKFKSKKKEALLRFEKFYFTQRPNFRASDAKRLLVGQEHIKTIGLVQASGLGSWKSFSLKKAACLSMKLLDRLVDAQQNTDAELFRRTFIELNLEDYEQMKLVKHLTGGGALQAASKLTRLLRQERPGMQLEAFTYDLDCGGEPDPVAKQPTSALSREHEFSEHKVDPNVSKRLERSLMARPSPEELEYRGILDPPKTKKGAIQRMLSIFLRKRQTKDELEKLKILKKPRVFGIPIDEVCANGVREGVPTFLYEATEHLLKTGVLLKGLFRVSGDQQRILMMKQKLDYGEPYNIESISPHSVAGLLKMFFRELPEPLICFHLYESLVNCYRDGQVQEIFRLVQTMGPNNVNTMNHLFRFLGIISHFKGTNKMTAANIAIVFAPNLMRPRVETFPNIARDTPITIGIIKDLITEGLSTITQEELDEVETGVVDPDAPAVNTANGTTAPPDAQLQSVPMADTTAPKPMSYLTPEIGLSRDQRFDSDCLSDSDGEPEPEHLERARTLPAPWQEFSDPDSGLPYYYNPKSNESLWTRPKVKSGVVDENALPDGWEEFEDPDTKTAYYYNSQTGDSVWTRPQNPEARTNKVVPKTISNGDLPRNHLKKPRDNRKVRSLDSAQKTELNRVIRNKKPRPSRRGSARSGLERVKTAPHNSADFTQEEIFGRESRTSSKSVTARPDSVTDSQEGYGGFSSVRATSTSHLVSPFAALNQQQHHRSNGQENQHESTVHSSLPKPSSGPRPKPSSGSRQKPSSGSRQKPSSGPRPNMGMMGFGAAPNELQNRLKSLRKTHRASLNRSPDNPTTDSTPTPRQKSNFRSKPEPPPRKSSSKQPPIASERTPNSYEGVEPPSYQPPPRPTKRSFTSSAGPAETVSDLQVEFKAPSTSVVVKKFGKKGKTTRRFEGVWRERLAGGNYPDYFTWWQNPQYKLHLKKTSHDITFSMTLNSLEDGFTPAVGFTVICVSKEKSEEGRILIIDLENDDVLYSSHTDPDQEQAGDSGYITSTISFKGASVLPRGDSEREFEQDEAPDPEGEEIYALIIAATSEEHCNGTFELEVSAPEDVFECSVIEDGNPDNPGWFHLAVNGAWNEETAGGCYPNYNSWRNNPQFQCLTNSQQMRILIHLERESEPDDEIEEEYEHPIGFYVFRNTGPAVQKLCVAPGDIVTCSEFVTTKTVSTSITLEEVQMENGFTPTYTIIPCTFTPNQLDTYTLTIFSEKELVVSTVEDEYRWEKTHIDGEWTEETAGGCRNFDTWNLNPQFMLTSPESRKVLVVLSQDADPVNMMAIGFYVLNQQGDIVGKGAFMHSPEVYCELDVDFGGEPFVIIPCTFASGVTGSFCLKVFSEQGAQLTECR